MAGLLAVFAAFEREILQERTRAGLANARQNGIRLGRPMTAGPTSRRDPETAPLRHPRSRDRPASGNRSHVGPSDSDSTSAMKKTAKRDPVREDRIHNEAIADANGPEEQAMGWQ